MTGRMTPVDEVCGDDDLDTLMELNAYLREENDRLCHENAALEAALLALAKSRYPLSRTPEVETAVMRRDQG